MMYPAKSGHFAENYNLNRQLDTILPERNATCAGRRRGSDGAHLAAHVAHEVGEREVGGHAAGVGADRGGGCRQEKAQKWAPHRHECICIDKGGKRCKSETLGGRLAIFDAARLVQICTPHKICMEIRCPPREYNTTLTDTLIFVLN